MAHRTSQQTMSARPAGHAARKRHWGRWTAAGVAGLAAVLVLAAGLFITLQPTPAALVLPAGRASAPAGPVDGQWEVTAGSVAGFRVKETVLGFSNDTVGRTSAVTGTLVVSGGRLTSAVIVVDLSTVKVNGKPASQFVRSLRTGRYPEATFTLARPVTLGPAFSAGATIGVTTAGRLELNGVSRPVTLTGSGRRDGTALQVTGTIPVAFSAWGITGPAGFGLLGSLANHGVAEFLLTLHQRLRRRQRLRKSGAAAQGVRDRDRGEAAGADGCAEGEPGDGDAPDAFRGGGLGRRDPIWRQVGERDSQFFPGGGAQDLPGPGVEFVGRYPAGLQGPPSSDSARSRSASDTRRSPSG
ncbi:MAG: YceI family protein [Streptosporangiaceae bacterium]|jgi:polyisoprenoid-binding protein YceI